MADDNKTEHQPQEKKAFVIREVDSSLLKRLSPNAFRLWMVLRKLADAKTGQVRIGVHWYSPREIEREVEMSHNTRKAAMRELIAVGLAHREKPRHAVTTTERLSDRPRKHVVWAEAQYYVSPTPRSDWLSSIDQTQKPNTGAGSSIDHKTHRRRKPHKQRASCIDQQNAPENNSSIDQSVGGPPNGRQVLQEPPKDLGASPLPLAVENNCPIYPGVDSQGSPAPKATPGYINADSLTATSKPLIDRVYDALDSHPQGLSVPSLVELLFGIPRKVKPKIGERVTPDPEKKYYCASSSIIQAVGRLRKKGYTIVTVNSNLTDQLYVLAKSSARVGVRKKQ